MSNNLNSSTDSNSANQTIGVSAIMLPPIPSFDMLILNWVQASNTDSFIFLETLSGSSGLLSCQLLSRDDSPSSWIMRSLTNDHEQAVLPTFSNKLCEVIEWLAINDEYRAKCVETMWVELLNLVKLIEGAQSCKGLDLTMGKLLDALYRDATPLLGDREIRREFTEYLITRQTDNRLVPCWIKLIENSNSDKVLYASLIDSLRGLFQSPELISTAIIEKAVKHAFSRISKATGIDPTNREKLLNNIILQAGDRYAEIVSRKLQSLRALN